MKHSTTPEQRWTDEEMWEQAYAEGYDTVGDELVKWTCLGSDNVSGVIFEYWERGDETRTKIDGVWATDAECQACIAWLLN